MVKRIIWTNEVDTSDAALAAARQDYADDEFVHVEKMDDQELIEFLNRENDNWRGDERTNLNVSTANPILVIADLGLWDGRKSGYKVLASQNVGDILSTHCGEYVTYYADCYNVYCDDAHHDGTNHYVFRELVGSEEECWPLLDAIYSGRDYSALMRRYSRSILPYVAGVYGWPVAGITRAKKRCDRCRSFHG